MFHRVSLSVMRCFVSIFTMITLVLTPALQVQPVYAADLQRSVAPAASGQSHEPLFEEAVATIQASLTYGWISGQNFPPNSEVVLTMTNAEEQTLFGPEGVPVDEWGSFFIDGKDGQLGFAIEPGMVISVDGGSAGSKELTLQTLTLDSADLETGEVSGTASSGSLVRVMAGNEQDGRQADAVAGENDGWVVDFTPGGEDDFPLLADMHFDAALTDEDGDQTIAQLTSAHIIIWLESNSLSAYDWPLGQAVTLTLISDNEPVYSASQMPEANWDNPNLGYVDFFLDGEHSLQPGQKVIVQSGNMVRRTTVQYLGPVAVDLDADVISGTAADGARIWGCVFTENGCVYRETLAGEDGVFTLDFSAGDEPYNLTPGDQGVVNWSDGQGNNNARSWRVWQGFLAANVQNGWIQFRDWPQYEGVTLKINGSVVGSTIMDQNPWNPGDPNDILALFENLSFQAGDELGIYDDEGVLIRALTVGELEVTGIDLANDLVSGTAARGAVVEVCVNTDDGCEMRRAQATDGSWAADFNQADPDQGENARDLVAGSSGWAAIYDDDGDQTQADWHIQEPDITANVQDRWVQSHNWPDGTEVTLKVDGEFVETVDAGPAYWNPEEILASFENVSMLPGQMISVSNPDGSITQSLQVANLTITGIDSENAVITGTTDPNLWLEVCANTMEGCLIRRTQADGSGIWAVDFAAMGSAEGDFGQTDSFAPGTNGWVAACEINGPDRTWLEWSLPGLPGLQASLTHDWIGGWNFSPDADLSVTIENQNGVVFASDSVPVDGGGNFWIDSQLHHLDLLPGMTITVADQALGQKVLTLVPLSLDSADLETDVISGTAPAGSMLTVNAGNEFEGRDMAVVTGDLGLWSADFAVAGFDLRPQMGFGVNHQDDDGDGTFAELTYAHIDVHPGENRISGYDWEVGQGNQVALELRDSEGNLLYGDSQAVQPDDQGRGQGYVDFNVPEDYPLLAGQRVVLTSGHVVRRTTIAELPAPTIDLAASRLIVAYPFPGAFINACVETYDGCIFREATWDEAAEQYVIDFLAAGKGETPYQLQPGDAGTINSEDGQNNRTSRRWKLWNPNITASMAGQWVHTREWQPGTEVTLSINGGDPIGPVLVGPAEWNEEDIVGAFQLEEGSIAAGDVLTVTDGVVVKTLTLVELTVDWSDRGEAILRGSTDPGMLVEAGVNRDEGEGGLLLRRVITDEDTGDWSADFSEPGALPDEMGTTDSIWDGAHGWVSAIDEDGDRTQLDWSIPNPHMDVWISHNFISVYDWPAGTELTLTVAEGGIERHRLTTMLENGSEELPGSEEFPLAAGQTVTLSGGGFERSLTVADLRSPTVDMANSTLSGQAPEGAFIWGCVFAGEDGCVWRGMEVGPDGQYLLDFDEGGPDEATHVFQPGDQGAINWAGDQGNNTSRFWSTGSFRLLAVPAGGRISGLDWPEGATVDVTVTDPLTSDSLSSRVTVEGAEQCGDTTCFVWEPVGWTLAPGQSVTATLGPVTKTITISALQITRVDALHDQVAGRANPNEEVSVSVITQSWVTRTVMADGDGKWMVDFSVPGGADEEATADLAVSDSGLAQQVDALTGDGTLVDWSVESPVVLSQDHLDENIPAGTPVGTFTPVYDLEGQALTYSLAAGDGDTDNQSFTIDGDVLRINDSPDYEAKSSYSIRIRVEDGGAVGKSFEARWAISINNLNEAPTAIDLSAASIHENAPAGSVVGIFSATDPDFDPAFTFSLVGGGGDTDNGAFSISETSLTINASPDYETKDSYTIRVRVTDEGDPALSLEKSFTISIIDRNEPPTTIGLTNAVIAENVPAGSIVGSLVATDPDSGQSFTYRLVSGTGSADNGMFDLNGSELVILTVPDYEVKSSYSIRVSVSDSGTPGLTFEQPLTVTVQNVEEAPILLSFSKTGLQDSPIAFGLADFSTHFIDPDSSGTGSLQRIKITGLPAHGELRVGDGPALDLDAEIEAGDLNRLEYRPDAGYNGGDGFGWNGSDGAGYGVNPAQVTLTIGFVPDYGLRVSPAGDAKSIKAEAARAVVASYSLTLTNTGNTAGSYRVTLMDAPGWATSISPAEIVNLPAGRQTNVMVQVTVPAGASGSQVSTLKIASTADPDVSVTVALTTTASAPPPPGPVLLSVAPASVNLAVMPSATVTLSGANFSEPMTVRIGGAASPAVTRKNSAELLAAVPAALTPGVYTVQVCNAAARCTSLPNSLTVLGEKPVIGSVYPSQGFNDAPNTILVRGYNLSAATTLRLSGVTDEGQPSGVQVSGGHLQATIPAGLPAGSYDLTACNGSACDTLAGAYLALDGSLNDFSASSEDLWTAPATIREGNTVVLGLNVHRLSGDGLAAAPVAFYVNDPGNPDNRISPASDLQTAGISAGGVDVVTATWTPTGLSGTVRIYAVIDPDHHLAEATRENNTVSTTIQILPRQADETEPVIEELQVNGGEVVTAQRLVSLGLTASDGPTGAEPWKMKVVERQYNSAARQWVVASETGWIDYQAEYTLTLTGQAGLHYIQVWVADSAGNISAMAQASINYTPGQAALGAGQVQIYRLALTAGEERSLGLESLTGDADLYVWDEDGNLVAASLETDPAEGVSFTAALSGTYQVEVYAYTDSTYRLDFDALPADRQDLATARVQGGLQPKATRYQPGISPRNEPLPGNPSEPAPIKAKIESYGVYIPFVMR